MDIYTERDFCPELQRHLPKIDETKIFFKEHGIKHPSAIYNVSLGKVEGAVSDFMEVFSKYEDIDFTNDDKKYTGDLLKTYRNVLYAFREHLDDCFSIVKTFVKPPVSEKKQRNQYRWLEINAQSETQDFRDSISEYKTYLDDSVNALKHDNAILAGIAFYDKDNGLEHCMGYFIANVVDGIYTPVEAIHPKYGSVYTGFSYRRDLHYNLFNLFKLSSEVLRFINDKAGVSVDNSDVTITEASEVKKNLYQKVMQMPRYHFPDEYVKSVPSVSITKGGYLKVAYPSTLTIKPNRLNQVLMTHSADGHTASFRVPYM